jgi:long-subunit acyl-CoA synthetase (AMP-forming)
MQIAFACFKHGIIVATCYANLGEEALEYSINQTGMFTLFFYLVNLFRM